MLTELSISPALLLAVLDPLPFVVVLKKSKTTMFDFQSSAAAQAENVIGRLIICQRLCHGYVNSAMDVRSFYHRYCIRILS